MKKIFTLALSLATVVGASAQMYIMGAGIEGSTWAEQGAGLELTATANGYEGTFTVVETGTGVGHFALITKNDCASWDELNGSYRLQPAGGEGAVCVPGEALAYELGSGAFQAPVGTFKFVVNTTDQTLTIIGDADPEPEPGPGPDPVANPLLTTGECYIFGSGVVGSDWQASGVGLALTDNGAGHFVGTFDFADGGYFSLAAKNDCVDWNELNGTYRCAPTTKDEPVVLGTPIAMAVQDASWLMEVGGTYTVDVDANAFTVTFTEGSGVQTIARDAKKSGIYNLQGMKVNEMIPGQLYIVDGKKVIATR